MNDIPCQRRYVIWILVVMLATLAYPGAASVGDDGILRESRNVTLAACCDRDSGRDFDTLEDAGNLAPEGIWSDGTTMWVADQSDEKIYAYAMATGVRDRGRDFNALDGAGNNEPTGIWSDRSTMWVADIEDDKIYAYNMTTKTRDPSKDINTLDGAGNNSPTGIWSDGSTMWVADKFDDKIYAYDMPTRNTATPVAPSILSLTAGIRSLTITWAAPAGDGVTAYDVRYIRSDAPDKADANWTVVEDAWTTGSGSLSHELTGLTGGTQYDVQVRAVTRAGDGPWSSAGAATPLGLPVEPTDFNGDGRTDFADFFLFADAYGGTDSRFDLDGNGRVDFADFFKFVDAFGA